MWNEQILFVNMNVLTESLSSLPALCVQNSLKLACVWRSIGALRMKNECSVFKVNCNDRNLEGYAFHWLVQLVLHILSNHHAISSHDVMTPCSLSDAAGLFRRWRGSMPLWSRSWNHIFRYVVLHPCLSFCLPYFQHCYMAKQLGYLLFLLLMQLLRQVGPRDYAVSSRK